METPAAAREAGCSTPLCSPTNQEPPFVPAYGRENLHETSLGVVQPRLYCRGAVSVLVLVLSLRWYSCQFFAQEAQFSQCLIAGSAPGAAHAGSRTGRAFGKGRSREGADRSHYNIPLSWGHKQVSCSQISSTHLCFGFCALHPPPHPPSCFSPARRTGLPLPALPGWSLLAQPSPASGIPTPRRRERGRGLGLLKPSEREEHLAQSRREVLKAFPLHRPYPLHAFLGWEKAAALPPAFPRRSRGEADGGAVLRAIPGRVGTGPFPPRCRHPHLRGRSRSRQPTALSLCPDRPPGFGRAFSSSSLCRVL